MSISLTLQCSACQGSHCVARDHDELGKPLLVSDSVLRWRKLKVLSPRRSEWGVLLPSLLCACWSGWESTPTAQALSRYESALRTQNCERTHLLLPSIPEILTLGLTLVDLGLLLILCPDDWQAEAQEKLSFAGKIFWLDTRKRILLLMPSVTWGKSHTHTQPDKLNPNKGKQIQHSRSETGKVTTDSRWIKTIKRWFWKQFHVNTFQIVTEMDAFLGNSKLDTRKRPK